MFTPSTRLCARHPRLYYAMNASVVVWIGWLAWGSALNAGWFWFGWLYFLQVLGCLRLGVSMSWSAEERPSNSSFIYFFAPESKPDALARAKAMNSAAAYFFLANWAIAGWTLMSIENGWRSIPHQLPLEIMIAGFVSTSGVVLMQLANLWFWISYWRR